MIFSIGHGGRTLESLVADLRRYEITYVVDVRSVPYSRHQPAFQARPLQAELTARDITYVYLGDALGGRPDDPACYGPDGAVDYARCRARPAFQRGLERLQSAEAQALRLCLMCAEGKPADCHRARLIGAALADLGIAVAHILPDGSLVSQAALIQPAQRALF